MPIYKNMHTDETFSSHWEPRHNDENLYKQAFYGMLKEAEDRESFEEYKKERERMNREEKRRQYYPCAGTIEGYNFER